MILYAELVKPSVEQIPSLEDASDVPQFILKIFLTS